MSAELAEWEATLIADSAGLEVADAENLIRTVNAVFRTKVVEAWAEAVIEQNKEPEFEITDQMMDTFREAWHKADQTTGAKTRVMAGIRALVDQGFLEPRGTK